MSLIRRNTSTGVRRTAGGGAISSVRSLCPPTTSERRDLMRGVRSHRGLAALLFGLLACLTTAAAAIAGATTHAAPKPIIIGEASAVTGILAPLDAPAHNGMQLAVAEINAKGGL